MQYIAPLANLIEHFRALPGIGQKTAVRLAYHVLDMDAAAAKSLAGAILEAKEKIGYCNTCFNLSDRNPCGCSTTQMTEWSRSSEPQMAQGFWSLRLKQVLQ